MRSIVGADNNNNEVTTPKRNRRLQLPKVDYFLLPLIFASVLKPVLNAILRPRLSAVLTLILGA